MLGVYHHVCHFFFFSSRRRHTRFDCDWSSDVCSSDLNWRRRPARASARTSREPWSSADSSCWSSRSSSLITEIKQAAWSPLPGPRARSEEHTSELQSQSNLVCRLLLEKKKTLLITCHS